MTVFIDRWTETGFPCSLKNVFTVVRISPIQEKYERKLEKVNCLENVNKKIRRKLYISKIVSRSLPNHILVHLDFIFMGYMAIRIDIAKEFE
jgi:hypothetical protein